MCRQEIPADYLDHPNLVRGEEELVESIALEDGNQWFYEGRNGWWQYDERTSSELEAAFKKGEKTCELLIAGFLYVVDFENMLQMRRNDPSRRRRIKRDLASIPKKGVAGLRFQIAASISQSALGEANRDFADGEEHESELALANSNAAPANVVSTSVACGFHMPLTTRVATQREIVKSPSPVPGPPNNTPHTNSGDASPAASDVSLSLAIEGIESLRLRDDLGNADEVDLYYDFDQSDLAHETSWTINTVVSSDEDNV